MRKKQQSRGCLMTLILFLSVVLIVLLIICYYQVAQKARPTEPEPTTTSQEASTENTEPTATEAVVTEPEPTTTVPENTEPTTTAPVITQPPVTEPPVTEPKPTETTPPQTEPDVTQPPQNLPPLVVIDAGHQAKGNREKEPLGPGSDEMKAKVTSGAQGVVTGLEEYVLNLQVAKKLQQLLEDRGYRVEMIRTTHDVNISNAERAIMANEMGADVFIRIHANSVDNAKTHGIMTLCQTSKNPFNSNLYAQSQKLAKYVLDEAAAATGSKKQFVWETDTMSGINWCQVPVTIVEMGYMSNPEEDQLMATDAYQQKMAEGIANGIDRYFGS